MASGYSTPQELSSVLQAALQLVLDKWAIDHIGYHVEDENNDDVEHNHAGWANNADDMQTMLNEVTTALHAIGYAWKPKSSGIHDM